MKGKTMEVKIRNERTFSFAFFLKIISIFPGLAIPFLKIPFTISEKIIFGFNVSILLELIIHLFETKPLKEEINSAKSTSEKTLEVFKESSGDIHKIFTNMERNGCRLFSPIYVRHQGDNIPGITDQLNDANEIWAVMWTGRDFIQKHRAFITQKCRDGATFKILLAKFDSAAVQIWEKWFNRDIDAEMIRVKKDIEEIVLQINPAENKEAQFKVNVIEDFIPFNLLATDPDKPEGQIVIAFQTYKGHASERPYVHICKKDDSIWYKTFINQFEDMWRVSTPI